MIEAVVRDEVTYAGRPARVFYPKGEGAFASVLFLMDGIGVRDALDRMAARIAAQGYTVLLPNLFWRSEPLPPVDPKTVFSNDAERAKLVALVQTVTPEKGDEDIAAALDFLASHPRVSTKKVRTVGYCMGGYFAVRAAGVFPDRVVAAASIHGSRLANDAPTSPHLLANQMKAEIYVGVAEIDHGHDAATTKRLDDALTNAHVAHTIELYPKVSHGFAPDDTPVHDAAASEKQLERVLALFERHRTDA